MKKKSWLAGLLLCFWMMAGAVAEAADEWIWIEGDAKYGKYFAPSHVKVESAINGVATELSAWTKTVYTVEGARETIANYGIEASIPDPKRLAYSTALLLVRPQTREIEYVQENFYDPAHQVIWSKIYEPRVTKEINSQSFDEDFYVAIVDAVFHYGERERQKAADRWVLLWESKAEGGAVSSARADMTTMRMAGENLIYWEWMETKDSAGNITEVKFMKKALNGEQGTEKIISGRVWDAAAGWQDMADMLDGRYVAIRAGTAQEHGLVRLRAFIKGYTHWLYRYRTDRPSGQKAGSPAATNPEPASGTPARKK
ncbi:MAG: hypothetical protein ACTTKW_07505 [Schwartzia sp. (in: firmicutes)]